MARARHLIDAKTQKQIAAGIDAAVAEALRHRVNHGAEEPLTAAIGEHLIGREIRTDDAVVTFTYRQTNKQTEEKHSGADGALLVRIQTSTDQMKKASLFQAKLPSEVGRVRQCRLNKKDAKRLKKQAADMIRQTSHSVVVFYVGNTAYAVDAARYSNASTSNNRSPLSRNRRLVTLGTYFGSWMGRCTKGDRDSSLVERAERPGGFRTSVSMDIIRNRPSVWPNLPSEGSPKGLLDGPSLAAELLRVKPRRKVLA